MSIERIAKPSRMAMVGLFSVAVFAFIGYAISLSAIKMVKRKNIMFFIMQDCNKR